MRERKRETETHRKRERERERERWRERERENEGTRERERETEWKRTVEITRYHTCMNKYTKKLKHSQTHSRSPRESHRH